MTKERRLAIEMWTNIRDRLASGGFTRTNIVDYKQKFCESHGLKWEFNCWCCQYVPSCTKCPLEGCWVAEPLSAEIDAPVAWCEIRRYMEG